MNSPDALRDRFAAGNLHTASASKIVTMCFDRLDRDLANARAAIDVLDHFECNEALGHAQDLLSEIAGMLDLEAWEHAGALMALYDYLLRLLAAANTTKDAILVAEAQRIVGELGEAFRAAAEVTGQPAADQEAPADRPPAIAGETAAPTDVGDRPRLSIQA